MQPTHCAPESRAQYDKRLDDVPPPHTQRPLRTTRRLTGAAERLRIPHDPLRRGRSADVHPPAAAAVVLRPVVPADRWALAQMLAALSPRSTYLRFFAGGFRVTDRALDVLMCDGGGRAFVAVEAERVIGHSMWAPTRTDDRRAEIAFVVTEDRRGRGWATQLTRLALTDATTCGLAAVEATVLAENLAAQRVVRRLLPEVGVSRSYGEITFAAWLDGR